MNKNLMSVLFVFEETSVKPLKPDPIQKTASKILLKIQIKLNDLVGIWTKIWGQLYCKGIAVLYQMFCKYQSTGPLFSLSVLSIFCTGYDVYIILAHRIGTSEIIPWARKSYLTHAILPRLSRES